MEGKKNTWERPRKTPPLKLTSMLIGISLIKILVFYKIFFLNELRVKFLSSGRSLSPSFFPDRGEMPKTPKFLLFY